MWYNYNDNMNEIIVSPKGTNFCYVDDTVRAILHALTHPEVDGNVFNVASGEGVAIRTMINKVCQLTGTGKPLFGEVPYRTGENMALYADTKKTKKYLSWEPEISIEEGLIKTIEYYQCNIWCYHFFYILTLSFHADSLIPFFLPTITYNDRLSVRIICISISD